MSISQDNIKKKMAENSKNWWKVDDKEKKRLERENQELSKHLDDAEYDRDSGKWNVLKYDKNKKGATGIKKSSRSIGGGGSSYSPSYVQRVTSPQNDEVDELIEELRELKKNSYKQNEVVEKIDRYTPVPVREVFDGANMEKMMTMGVGLVFLSIIASLVGGLFKG